MLNAVVSNLEWLARDFSLLSSVGLLMEQNQPHVAFETGN
jgi:hypothetical protein